MWFGGSRKSTPLNDRLAVLARSGVPAIPSHGPSGQPRAWAGALATPGERTITISLASERLAVQQEQARRTHNANSIIGIPNHLLMCPGKRAVLWSLAINGEDVYAAPPNLAHPADWMLCLWGQWVRLIPCDMPPMVGEFSGNVDDYRPTHHLTGTPRVRVHSARLVPTRR